MHMKTNFSFFFNWTLLLRHTQKGGKKSLEFQQLMQNQRCDEQSHHYMSDVKLILKGWNFTLKAKNIWGWHPFKWKKLSCVYLFVFWLGTAASRAKMFTQADLCDFFDNLCSLWIALQCAVKSMGLRLLWGVGDFSVPLWKRRWALEIQRALDLCVGNSTSLQGISKFQTSFLSPSPPLHILSAQ